MKSFKPASALDRASILYIKYLIEREFGNIYEGTLSEYANPELLEVGE